MKTMPLKDTQLVTRQEIEDRIQSIHKQFDTLNNQETGRNGYIRGGQMEAKMDKLRKFNSRIDALKTKLKTI